MSYSFELRRKEMGIRLALGASRGNLYALVFRHGIALTVVVVLVSAAAACIGPARRVGSESPTTALRAD